MEGLELGELGRALFDADETDDLLARIERAGAAAVDDRDASARVAGLTYDSVLDDEWSVRMRAAPTQRLLTFTSGGSTIELAVEAVLERRQLSGRISPAHGRAIELAHRDGRRSVPVDDAGCFVFDDVPAGVVRVGWSDAGDARLETPWVAI